MGNEHYQVALVTVGKMDEAKKIAEALVEEKLAACVNLVERCESIYRWEGRIVKDSEVLMIVKTHRSCFGRLIERVKALHSYEVPEIIALDISMGSQSYLDFLKDALAI
ncbi:MAG: divalent cation tolerance protein CutA [Candidatus Latescibacteria bacterium]|nr:divalent cation tolerance protein CutA [Candidatus Latescibacterota bacterium]NIO27260.1 divalent cation tolerance protein CutA [Candidatus Latescibacterota bacterium]NIO54784.1 divalent cation tolerance protein CutA [Candidatus Latescibacterota bacterium]NIT00867.1 divalent cation tolerance protein CutA [Candidatus Latescibacterota bacterium]NIT37790.1 divalent cation tolerance protein CutA [Candidatus Latescibacterota bacterium]